MTAAAAVSPGPGWATSPCEACKAPVIWGATAKGKRVCVDAEPAMPRGGQSAVLLSGSGRHPIAEVVTDRGRLFGRRTVYRRHLDTCPYKAHYTGRAQRRRA